MCVSVHVSISIFMGVMFIYVLLSTKTMKLARLENFRLGFFFYFIVNKLVADKCRNIFSFYSSKFFSYAQITLSCCESVHCQVALWSGDNRECALTQSFFFHSKNIETMSIFQIATHSSLRSLDIIILVYNLFDGILN